MGFDTFLFAFSLLFAIATVVKVRITRKKAKEMLSHGEVHGQPLTQKQRGLFGVIASGKKPTKLKIKRKKPKEEEMNSARIPQRMR